jgi:hypothetical protein
LQSIVPEVDEEVEEEPENTPLTAFLQPEGTPKTLKRKRSLVEVVLVSGRRCTASRHSRMLYLHIDDRT